MKVTCNSPSSLSGVPVWNVSVCVTAPPWQPTPGTQTSLPPERPGVHILASTPGAPGAPTLASTATGMTANDVSTLPSRPASDTVVVPTLIAVIVVLCMLLFVVCFLALPYRRNRNSKTVAPGSSKRDVGSMGTESPGHPETRDLTESVRWDSEMQWRRHVSAVRAKSAHAVLFTASFGVFDKDTGSSDDTNTADVTEEKEEQRDSNRGPNSFENAPSVPANAETAPYMSIGASLSNPNADLSMQATNTPGQRSYKGKMGRISTWPPTAVQWEMRCKMKAQEEAARGEVMMAGSEAEPPAGFDRDEQGRVAEDATSRSSQVSSEGVCHERLAEAELSNPVDETIKSKSCHESSSVSLISEDQTQTEARQEEQLNLSQDEIHEAAAVREWPTQNRGLNPAANEQIATQSSEGHAHAPRGPHKVSSSKAPFDGDNEGPGSVDLLHEVVQNHGRWTRERWRQTHLGKQQGW
ncbi:uncharacterized protein LOC143001392 [Genypterus blacodes]|uniref:uncharacterized protein LOC143001392 n=1 Tax=Genypterus blacodes TaxID=154954 RepID=UPI003F76FD90